MSNPATTNCLVLLVAHRYCNFTSIVDAYSAANTADVHQWGTFLQLQSATDSRAARPYLQRLFFPL